MATKFTYLLFSYCVGVSPFFFFENSKWLTRFMPYFIPRILALWEGLCFWWSDWPKVTLSKLHDHWRDQTWIFRSWGLTQHTRLACDSRLLYPAFSPSGVEKKVHKLLKGVELPLFSNLWDVNSYHIQPGTERMFLCFERATWPRAQTWNLCRKASGNLPSMGTPKRPGKKWTARIGPSCVKIVRWLMEKGSPVQKWTLSSPRWSKYLC